MNNDELRIKNKERLDKLRKLNLKITTYEEIENFIKSIPNAEKYSGVYGVPRGGIIFAFLFSYYYDVPMLLAPCKNCLVIDDDIGTGITINKYIGKYDTAVMFSNEECPIKPDYIFQYYNDKEYRVFPWNIKESS